MEADAQLWSTNAKMRATTCTGECIGRNRVKLGIGVGLRRNKKQDDK